jgi:hypothetical protein
MPYKRRSRFWWIFSIPPPGPFFQKRRFFNSHAIFHQSVTSSARNVALRLADARRRVRQLATENVGGQRKVRMTWRELNDQLRKATKVKPILQLYKAERKGKRRRRWLTRIYCRYSYLRRKKEMKAVASAESFV